MMYTIMTTKQIRGILKMENIFPPLNPSFSKSVEIRVTMPLSKVPTKAPPIIRKTSALIINLILTQSIKNILPKILMFDLSREICYSSCRKALINGHLGGAVNIFRSLRNDPSSSKN